MTNRIAIAAGSAAAALTLAIALAAAGFAPKPAAPATLTTTVTPAAAEPAAAPTVQVDTIYLAPPAEPQTITVEQPARGDGEAGEDGEHESGGDD